MNDTSAAVKAPLPPPQHPQQQQSTTATAISSLPTLPLCSSSNSCRVCGSLSELRRCSRCKSAFYCSQTHQQADWPNHRTECRQIMRLLEVRQHQQQYQQLQQQQQQSLQLQQQQQHNVADAVVDSMLEMATKPLTPFELAAAQMQRDREQQQQLLHEKKDRDMRNFGAENTMRVGEMNGGLDSVQGASNLRDDDLCKIIINDMNTYGLSVIDDFLGRTAGMEILREVDNMYGAGVFQNGQLVSNTTGQQNQQTIRGDKITWVKGTEPACTSIGFLINQIDNLVISANRMRDNGTLGQYKIRERTKAMVACYPGSGAQYVMHVDNPNQDGRVITAIYYLNVDWDSSKYGGQLTITPKPGNSLATIDPAFDRILFFWSDRRNPHGVQPAHHTRYAITVWYFDADEREAALQRNRNQQLQLQQQQQQQQQQQPQAASAGV